MRGGLLPTWRHVRNVWLDLHYGEPLGGRNGPQRYRALGAYSSLNSDYGLLAQIFAERIRPDDVLVDIGSGRGRVLNFWLHAGHRGPMFGLEIDEDHASRSARRLARWRNVTVRQGDAVANLPAAATLLFMFNPFDCKSMRRLRDAIPQRVSAIEQVRILYYAPTCLEAWTEDERWSVELHEVDLKGIEHCAERHRRYASITPSAAFLQRCIPPPTP